MSSQSLYESFKAESADVAARIRALVKEGNLRRVIVEHDGKTVAEFPLTAGVIGAALAPVLAAVAALVALLEDCTIHVEVVRTVKPEKTGGDHAPLDVEC
jgi:hypothetical protein